MRTADLVACHYAIMKEVSFKILSKNLNLKGELSRYRDWARGLKTRNLVLIFGRVNNISLPQNIRNH